MRITRRHLLSLAAGSSLCRAFAKIEEAKKQYKITGIETDLLRLPQAEFTGDAIHDFGSTSGGVVLRVLTDAGITGWGYSNFAAVPGGPRVVQTILESEIKPVLIGKDPAFPRRIRADLWNADVTRLHPAKAPLLKKLVKPLLQVLLGAKEEKMPGGTMKYDGALNGTSLKVRVDYAARDVQMIYSVSIRDPECKVVLTGSGYEHFFGMGGGWDYITEENAEASVGLLPELLRRVLALRNEVARLDSYFLVLMLQQGPGSGSSAGACIPPPPGGSHASAGPHRERPGSAADDTVRHRFWGEC